MQPAQSGRPAVPDQDALCYRSRPGTDRLVVVVCDDAGRAAEGRISAPAAAAAALESGSELTESPNQDRPNLLRCTDTAVRQTVIQLAATSGISLLEYAAMLTALIQANGRAASAQVGDGAGVVGADAGWMLTSEPQRGEHANETWFITQEDAIYRRRVSAEISGVQRVMICLTLKQPGKVPDAPYFDGAFPGWRATTARKKRSGRCRNCCSATRCDYSPTTTTSPCSRQLFCTQRRRPKTNHKKTVPITERRLNIQQGQRHEAHHIPDGPKVLLGVRIAPGGEGSVHEVSVHEVSGNQDLVAIYHQGRRPPGIEEKLRQMVSRPPGGNAPDGVAWPWARFVADWDGQTHGYLMQRAKPGAMPAAVFRS